MAFGPDGALYVTNNATDTPPGSGEVLKLTVPPMTGESLRPRPDAVAPVAAPPPATQPQPSAAPAAQPRPPAAPAASPAPAQLPRGLPRTGGASNLIATVAAPLALLGGTLLLAGLALRGRRT